MPQLSDDELGTITIRRNPLSRSIRMRLAADGTIVVSAPMHTPLSFIKQAVRGSRRELLDMQKQARPALYVDGQAIGQSHHLAIVHSDLRGEIHAQRRGTTLVVTLPSTKKLDDVDVQQRIREEVRQILRREAKSYLPRRLATLAERHGYRYQTVRFPHAISRWGSCSTSGTISLNIALMKLSPELIDYVIFHELSHTRHMDHSHAFWNEVKKLDPDYELHRRLLKRHSPIV